MTIVELVIEVDPDVPSCATVLVDATVNGDHRRFIVDTGAGTTTVVADELTRTLPLLGYETSAGLFGATADARVTIAEFRLGRLAARSIEVLLTEQPPAVARNLLGMNVLGEHRCHFRFLDRPPTLHLSPTATTPVAVADEELMIGPRGQPFVMVSWPDGTSARALWDSGAAITVVDTTFHERYPQLFEAVGEEVGTDSTGTQQSTPTCHVATATTGAVTVDEHIAAIIDLTPTNTADDGPRTDLVLGYPALSQANWVLDFSARRWSASTVRHDSTAERC